MVVNPHLARKHKLSKDTIIKIEELHLKNRDILKKMNKLSKDNVPQLKALFITWTNNNFKLQELWGFKKNVRMQLGHLLPHCTCPTNDNNDRGSHVIISSDCIYHTE